MSESFLDVSVVICSRNRARQLAEVLESASRMHVPDGLAWELVVIDNGSSDNTSDVALSFSDRIPVRVVREDVPGLSNARNRGVAEARGEYICWTDDDVVIGRDWMSSYVAAFRKHPEAVVFGGRVIPFLEGGNTPLWFEMGKFSQPVCSLLAYRDFGDQETELSFEGNMVPYGANYAIRASEQREYRYDPSLGVSPTHKMLGEEVDVISKILKRGFKGWWVPGSRVEHIIPASRQTKSYLYEYHFLAGATMMHMRIYHRDWNFLLAGGGAPAGYDLSWWRCYRRAFNRLLRYIFSRRQDDDVAWVQNLADFGYYLGAASYKRRESTYLIGLKDKL